MTKQDLEAGENYEYTETDEAYKLLEPRETYDQAIVGLMNDPEVVCYDAAMVINLTADLHEMSVEEAHEFFDFNIAGSKGEGFPVYVWTDVTEELQSHDQKAGEIDL
jgi:hypothetical protein